MKYLLLLILLAGCGAPSHSWLTAIMSREDVLRRFQENPEVYYNAIVQARKDYEANERYMRMRYPPEE